MLKNKTFMFKKYFVFYIVVLIIITIGKKCNKSTFFLDSNVSFAIFDLISLKFLSDFDKGMNFYKTLHFFAYNSQLGVCENLAIFIRCTFKNKRGKCLKRRGCLIN